MSCPFLCDAAVVILKDNRNNGSLKFLGRGELLALFLWECRTRLFHNLPETPKLPANLEHWMIPVGSSLLATCGLEVLKMGCSE